jgi:hypothetical protein
VTLYDVLVERVECTKHGTPYETFVYEHLVGASGVKWFSSAPTADDPWPSAWCEKCQRAFAAEGKWNELSEQAANLKAKLLCHHCYEQFRDACLTEFV